MPKVHFIYQRKQVVCQAGETICDVAKAHDIPIFHRRGKWLNCRGLGFCKACRVRVIRASHVSPKSFLERIRLLPNPWRQACQTRILDDVIVWTQGEYPTRLESSEAHETTASTGASGGDNGSGFEIEEIRPEDVKHLLDNGHPIVLLDVREPMELERARIDGSISIPLSQLGARHEELDPEADIIIYCHHGIRSQTAAEILLTSGFKRVRNMAGGIDGWSLKVDFSVPRY